MANDENPNDERMTNDETRMTKWSGDGAGSYCSSRWVVLHFDIRHSGFVIRISSFVILQPSILYSLFSSRQHAVGRAALDPPYLRSSLLRGLVLRLGPGHRNHFVFDLDSLPHALQAADDHFFSRPQPFGDHPQTVVNPADFDAPVFDL